MEPTAADLRAVAVAKIKRATSLPRMKDGRRPAMPDQPASGQQEERPPDNPNSDAVDPPAVEQVTAVNGEDIHPPENGADKAQVSDDDDKPLEVIRAQIQAEKSRGRPRSRSRSRSRNRKSQDHKLQAQRQNIEQNQTQDDSSPEESPFHVVGQQRIPVESPIPLPPQFARTFLPHPFYPPSASPFLHPPTSPPTPLPSFEVIQARLGASLHRSQSASATARTMAYNRLIGVPLSPEMFNGLLPSPTSSPAPLGSRLGRSNTLAGGERSVAGERTAVGKLMMGRLKIRVNQVDGDQTSGAEEAIAEEVIMMPNPPKKKRRHSNRRVNSASSSTSTSNILDDRDLPSTPQAFASSLPGPGESMSAIPPLPQDPEENGSEFRQLHNRSQSGVRGGLVVEDDYDLPAPPPSLPGGLPVLSTPPSNKTRAPHSSDAASTISGTSDSRIPVYLSGEGDKLPFVQQDFPVSAYGQNASPGREPEEDEDIVYNLDNVQRRTPWMGQSSDSWVVPPGANVPLEDEDDDDDEEEDEEVAETPPAVAVPEEEESIPQPSPLSDSLALGSQSPAHSSRVDPSPSPGSAFLHPSTAHTPLDTEVDTRISAASSSPVLTSLSPGLTPSFSSHDPDSYWEDTATDRDTKRTDGIGGWERVKRTLIGRGNQNGDIRRTRSRSNSLARRTESGASRESGLSIRGEQTLLIPSGSPLPSTPASTSMLSLSPVIPAPRGGVSPVPPASPADLARYTDAKLNPFPGIARLEQERELKRTRGMSINGISPEIVLSPSADRTGFSPISATAPSSRRHSPETDSNRHQLAHHTSDSKLLARHQASAAISSNQSNLPSSLPLPQMDYFDIPPSQLTQGNGKLPTTREGVRKWLSSKRSFFGSSSQARPATPTSPAHHERSTPTPKPHTRSPSVKDLFSRIGSDTEREEPITNGTLKSHPSRGSPKIKPPKLDLGKKEKPVVADLSDDPYPAAPSSSFSASSSREPSSLMDDSGKESADTDFGSSFPQSGQRSSSPWHLTSPISPQLVPQEPKAPLVVNPSTTRTKLASITMASAREARAAETWRQLRSVLNLAQDDAGRPSALDDPPRRLLLASSVLQVVNQNIVKDRYLLLFNDILVIAKPVIHDDGAARETHKPALDKLFTVKNVIELSKLQFKGNRSVPSHHPSLTTQQHVLVRTFIEDFNANPEHAVELISRKLGSQTDGAALIGSLLFETTDLDRTRLGEFLSRTESKPYLKVFIDKFNFADLRIDKALRIFFMSFRLPAQIDLNSFENLLREFASCWFKANVGGVGFGRNLALQLVSAMVQLNHTLHSGQHATVSTNVFSSPPVSSTVREFITAFRRYDPRNLVRDEILETVYMSIRQERLVLPSDSLNGHLVIPISIVRGLSSNLITYRLPSEPISIKIPRPDPHFKIELYGRDLVFEPPILNFSKSSEASFRVSGKSLGTKTMVMARVGPNAALYTGLPLSKTLTVEREFLRNTFQVAFLDQSGAKRKYMFSVDEAMTQNHWVTVLERQISRSQAASQGDPSLTLDQIRLAAESVAFQVLRESLASPADNSDLQPNKHVRSKSQSKFYPMASSKLENDSLSEEHRPDSVLAECNGSTGHDIVLISEQNSVIPSLLLHLHSTSIPTPPNDANPRNKEHQLWI